MKLSWKLFFLTTPVFILFLTVLGSWTLQNSFQRNLDQEIRRCMAENQTFQNSYELTRHGISEKQLAQVTPGRLIGSFYRKDGNSGIETRILDQDGNVLYQDTMRQLKHSIREVLTEEQNVGYELVKVSGEMFLVVMCLTGFDQYIETTENISHLYEARSDVYARYQLGMLFVCLFAGSIILIVIFVVTRNVQTLSGAVRRFADGQYDVRVKMKGRDEIASLADDFNWMADVMTGQMEHLQHEVERQEEFTSAFAHELKTPLTSIIGYADTIRQMDLSKEEVDMCADYIYRQGKRLQSLSYKLLEMTMVEKGRLETKEISILEFLQSIVQTVEPAYLEKNLTIHLNAQEGLICGDKDLLMTVFINFLDNARKASPKGGQVFLDGKNEAEGYRIKVIDQGRGIPREELTRITEAFYMVDKSRARKEGGAGLGLALCRKILLLHNAIWRIESEENIGTTVTVMFPNEYEKKRERRKRRNRDGR